eukprot:348878_1
MSAESKAFELRIVGAQSTFSVTVEKRNTIMHVKQLIALREGWRIKDFQFIWQGRPIEDTKTLEYYGIQPQGRIENVGILWNSKISTSRTYTKCSIQSEWRLFRRWNKDIGTKYETYEY